MFALKAKRTYLTSTCIVGCCATPGCFRCAVRGFSFWCYSMAEGSMEVQKKTLTKVSRKVRCKWFCRLHCQKSCSLAWLISLRRRMCEYMQHARMHCMHACTAALLCRCTSKYTQHARIHCMHGYNGCTDTFTSICLRWCMSKYTQHARIHFKSIKSMAVGSMDRAVQCHHVHK